MKLSKLEQESIILYNEEESTASIYTHDPKLKRKLKRLAEKYPDKVYPDKAVHAGAVSYAVPKSCVSVREPFSDERRRAASERAKNAKGRENPQFWPVLTAFPVVPRLQATPATPATPATSAA